MHTPPASSPTAATLPRKRKNPLARALQRAIESKKVKQKSFDDYRTFVKDHYDGFAGELTGLTGVLTGHAVLAGKVFKPHTFDVRGCKRILDAGCGNGRYTRYLQRQSDPDALIAAFDLSAVMLQRASRHLDRSRVHHVAADLTRLPYPTACFDAVVCGWVLEHLPDPRLGLLELARVLRPGGKMLLLTTEDTMPGSFCSYFWHCRTYNRTDLERICADCGLKWERPFYFTKLHRMFHLGGIIVQLRRV